MHLQARVGIRGTFAPPMSPGAVAPGVRYARPWHRLDVASATRTVYRRRCANRPSGAILTNFSAGPSARVGEAEELRREAREDLVERGVAEALLDDLGEHRPVVGG